jgi:hypothetical protein
VEGVSSEEMEAASGEVFIGGRRRREGVGSGGRATRQRG